MRKQPGGCKRPEADAGARSDDQAERRLAAHVRDKRALDAHEERLLSRSRRKTPVDRTAEPLHVEQHVDRDDEQQHRREERLADRDRGSLDERDDLVRVLADVALADLSHEAVAALLHLHGLQAVRVQPVLQPVDVAVGGGLSGGTVTMGEVRVEPVCRRLRLPDDCGRDREDDEPQRRSKGQIHEGDREAARQAHLLEGTHERIEQERHEGRDNEEKDDVSGRAREHPREDEQHRQAHQLHPPRDLDPRAHRRDATAARRVSRPPDWDWSWTADGALALKPREPFATVPPMPPPVANRRTRAAQRRHLERERRLCRLAVLLVVVAIGLVMLLLSAFGGSGSPAPATAPASPSRLLPAGPPLPEIVARLGSALRLQLPVSQSRVTAIGYQGGSDGALALAPLGTQVNQGLLKRLLSRRVHGSSCCETPCDTCGDSGCCK